MLRRPLLVVLLALHAVIVAIGGARAEGFRGAPSGLTVPREVIAGEHQVLEWQAPAGVLELELEISLDDGRSWSRLSPELHGAVQSWSWRVPSTPSEHARLRLRVGTEHGEYDLEPTEAFRIALPEGAEPLPAWHPHAWRGHAALPGAFGRTRPHISPGEGLPAADSTSRAAGVAPSPTTAGRSPLAWSSATPAPARPTGHAPRFVPMRN